MNKPGCDRIFSPDADDCVNCKERPCRDSKTEWMPENPYSPNTPDDRQGEAFNMAMAFEEGGIVYLQAALKWLEEPCTNPEHYYPRKAVPKYPRFHKDCPECMQQFKSEVEKHGLHQMLC